MQDDNDYVVKKKTPPQVNLDIIGSRKDDLSEDNDTKNEGDSDDRDDPFDSDDSSEEEDDLMPARQIE